MTLDGVVVVLIWAVAFLAIGEIVLALRSKDRY